MSISVVQVDIKIQIEKAYLLSSFSPKPLSDLSSPFLDRFSPFLDRFNPFLDRFKSPPFLDLFNRSIAFTMPLRLRFIPFLLRSSAFRNLPIRDGVVGALSCISIFELLSFTILLENKSNCSKVGMLFVSINLEALSLLVSISRSKSQLVESRSES